MILTSFSYSQPDWKIKGLKPLKFTNLLVGRNSSGKTRTLRAIQIVASFLQMKEYLFAAKTFNAKMTFSDPEKTSWHMKYEFAVSDGKIDSEVLVSGSRTLIDRRGPIAKYSDTVINPPAEKLVVQVRRDVSLFPEIEQLMSWAESVFSVFCGEINLVSSIFANKLFTPVSFVSLVEALTKKEKALVYKRCRNLGYKVTNIDTVKPNPSTAFVSIKETGVKSSLVDFNLSTGMMRTLYILCFIEYLKNHCKAGLLLIDDIGEGLDYHRSVSLGKLLFEDCEKYGIQLVASSNDSFLMDVVDIDRWQILERNKGIVTTVNQAKYPDVFKEFKMTGLSNFDFFSSDFIDSHLTKRTK